MSNTIQGMPRVDLEQFRSQAHKPAGDKSEFLDTLRGAMNQVQQLQSDAQHQVADMLQGKGEDIHTAMIAVEKADLAFQLMMRVRNKIVQAYQEVARMPF